MYMCIDVLCVCVYIYYTKLIHVTQFDLHLHTKEEIEIIQVNLKKYMTFLFIYMIYVSKSPVCN